MRNDGEKLSYKAGDTILYRTFGGDVRTVLVENREADVKNGRPGFDGKELYTGNGVWGYDDQIIRVVRVK